MTENSGGVFERYKREYVDMAPIILGALEAFDDDSPYSRELRNRCFPHYFMEYSLDYDSYCDSMVSALRKSKNINLNCTQIKEILRLRHILNRYDAIMEEVEYSYEDEQALLKVMLDNPQWKKISRQSHKILGLLRRRSEGA